MRVETPLDSCALPDTISIISAASDPPFRSRMGAFTLALPECFEEFSALTLVTLSEIRAPTTLGHALKISCCTTLQRMSEWWSLY